MSLTTELVLDLADIAPGMLSVVGGKAANLGELARAGLPVPPGVCLTTEAYRQVAQTAGLAQIHDALAGVAATDVVALAALAGRARLALLTTPVPVGIAEQVAAAYAQLGPESPVAIRSSATAEDLPFASFAGQQDTYLNVVGEAEVLDAVRRCWASLWTDRAVTYRAANGIDHNTVRLAVVIQRMVDAAVAGVLFTANPVTGHRHQTVIDASPGLGEAVVSGAVNPDHFVMDTARRVVLSHRLGDKRLAVWSLPGGGTTRVDLDPSGEQPCVTEAQLLVLTDLGRRVAVHFGTPQDIEWAIDQHGVPWLTQARPITTLYPLPVGTAHSGIRVYFSASVAQGLYRPITPMGLSGFRVIASSMARMLGFPVANPLAGPAVFAPAGQRLFLDVTLAVRSRIGRFVIPRILGVMEARSALIMRGLFEDPRLSVTHPSRVPFLRRVGRVFVHHRVPWWLGHALVRPRSALASVERVGVELERRLALPDDVPATRRLDFVEDVLGREFVHLAPRILPVAGAGFVALGLARKLLGSRVAPGELHTVLRGVPHNVTTEMDLELWQLATRLRADEASVRMLRDCPAEDLAGRFRAGTLPPVTQAGMTSFLRRYGHRAVAEIDLGMPRWSDDPGYLFQALINYLRVDEENGGDVPPDRMFAQSRATAEVMVDVLAARCGGLRGRMVRVLLGRCRQLAGVRELPKYHMVRVLAACRRQLALVGAELASQGGIEMQEDVFFLELAEARTALSDVDMTSVVRRRRSEYDEELRRRHVPRILLSDGTEPQPAAQAAEGAGLAGSAASPGTVTATARVILNPADGHLEPGEILVAPSTDPGWTPLFLTAGGLVMEMGGVNSHGAVVAREYGIPAVVGVPDATARITTGQRVTVDGTTGTVTLDPPS